MAVFQCPDCDITKTVPDKYLGRKVRCPQCKEEREVRDAGKLEEMAEQVAIPKDGGGDALFRCGKCGHTEPASADAIGETRVCHACSAKGTVVPLQSTARELTAEDVAVDDLADELAEDIGEDIGEDMDAIMPSISAPAKPLPKTLLDGTEEKTSFFQGNPAQNVIAGLSSGLLAFFFCLSMAVLIFPAGWETGHFGFIFDALVVSTIIGMLLAPLRSRVYFGIPSLDPASAAVLYCVLTMLVAAMPDATPEVVLPTALVCVAGITFATGLLAWFTWAFKSGSWIRFMPVQILGGVLAGLGVTVIAGACLFMTGGELSFDTMLDGIVNWEVVQASGSYWAWLPGTCLGVVLFVFFHKLRHPGFMALVLGGVTALGYGLTVSGIDLPQELMADFGMLTHPAPDVSRYLMLYSGGLADSVDWALLLSLRVEIAAAVVLMLTMALYKITRVESELGYEIRLEKELQVLGANNILAGLAGGTPLSFCLGRSLGNKKAGAGGPLATMIAGLLLLAALLFAGPVFPKIPAFVPGGLLVFFGLNLIAKWLIAARKEFFRSDDYMLLVLTFAMTVTLGFVLGVGTGLALAMMVSVTRYGSGGVIKQIFSGANHRSHVDRAPAQDAHLKKHGDAIFVIRLQGFVTVGALYGVIRETRRRMLAPDRPQVATLIYDFGAVQRFGSAMSQGFARLHALGLEHDINLVLTHVPFEIENRLAAAGYVDEDRDGGFKMFQNLDYALEWAENKLLAEADLESVNEQPLQELLAPVYPEPKHIPYLMKLLQPIKIKSGQYVFKQGDPSDAMYFVQSGMYRVELSIEGGKTMRLKKMGPGAVFGEMGLYTDAPRSASVVASEGGTVYRLSKKRIALIETKLPKLKSSIDRYLVNLMSGRIADANAMVHDLMR